MPCEMPWLLMRNVIVLIGAPATGKSTLALMLKEKLNCRLFSFDQLFPLETLKFNGGLKSKDARAAFVNMVEDCDSSWIVVDDTNHFHSMQKRYLNLRNAKVLFVYLKAEKNQISLLVERNLLRCSDATAHDIESIANHLINESPIGRNVMHFNFSSVPENVINLIQRRFESMELPFELKTIRVPQVPNARQKLNSLLNERINQAFQSNRHLNGKLISRAKKIFLASHSTASFDDLDDLVDKFMQEHLK